MDSRRPLLNKSLTGISGVLLLLAALIAVNVLAGYLPLRVDITEEGLYTLSDGSRQILEKFEDPVTVKYYFNESLPDVPVTIKSYAQKVRELLAEYENASGGKMTLEVSDPKPDTDEEEWAKRYGVSPVQLPSGSRLFHGMVILSGGKESVVPFFDPRRERFLEYDISEAMVNVRGGERPVIGILSYLPVFGQGMGPQGQPPADWAFVQQLRRSFTVEQLSADSSVEIPERIKLLILIHPKIMPQSLAYNIDQFLMRGGRLMVFTDPLSRMDNQGNPMMGGGMASSDLGALNRSWKITFNRNNVVGDPLLATRVNTPNAGVVSFPVWISLREDYINRDSIITSQLDDLTLVDPGSFQTMEGFEYKFTPLLQTSPNAGTVPAMTVRMSQPMDVAKALKPDEKTHVLAGLLTGKLKSAFPNGAPPPAPKEDGSPGEAPKHTQPHKAEADQDVSVLLVGDSDFIADRFSVQVVNFFGQQVVQPINDNMNFLLNAVEFMAGGQELIHVRSRGQLSRPFTKVAEIQMEAQQEYRQQEEALAGKLEEVRKRLQELQKTKEAGKDVLLGPAQAEAIKKFRLEEQRVSRALREVRKVLRQDIERLDNTLLAMNLLVIPFLVAVAGFVVIIRRSKRQGGQK